MTAPKYCTHVGAALEDVSSAMNFTKIGHVVLLPVYGDDAAV